ncbi:C39 family peptidase, partial [Anaerosalibacter bizertensis]|nr:C39 family peptidase [Anaerosalibacter bizertensis]
MQIDTEGIPEIVLQGTYDIKTLKKSLKKTGTVIDLSGCSLDSVLYEISAQRPVIAKTGADTSVVIVGYDEYNTWLYDPVKKETYPYGMNDSTDLFQKA